jgi:2-phosphosulfolactate phosphatase
MGVSSFGDFAMSVLRVHFLPELVKPAALAGSRCVIVDALRATTTIVESLASGATAVIPCLTIEDARGSAAKLEKGSVLLGGERGGRPIDGFDLGNSPAEYTRERVAGKTVVLTTTNGTKALLHSAAGSQILIGAFVNLSAVCAELQRGPQGAAATPIDIVCAGTDGHITREDVLFAGAVADRLTGSGLQSGFQLNDEAEISRDAWRHVAGENAGGELQQRVAAAMRASRGGRNLIEIGMAGDIELAARVDRHAIVCQFTPDERTITIY